MLVFKRRETLRPTHSLRYSSSLLSRRNVLESASFMKLPRMSLFVSIRRLSVCPSVCLPVIVGARSGSLLQRGLVARRRVLNAFVFHGQRTKTLREIWQAKLKAVCGWRPETSLAGSGIPRWKVMDGYDLQPKHVSIIYDKKAPLCVLWRDL